MSATTSIASEHPAISQPSDVDIEAVQPWHSQGYCEAEIRMPHVIVKLYAGRSERQKAKLAAEITTAIMASVNCGEEAVSVGIKDIRPNDWTDKVFKPDIIANWDSLYKKPGYSSV